MKNDEQTLALWSKYVAGEHLSDVERSNLLIRLESDPAFREAVLSDDEMHGILRFAQRVETDSESFVEFARKYMAKERETKTFAQGVETRIAEVRGAAARSSPHRTTRRSLQRRRGSRHGLYWMMGLAAAGLLVFAVLLDIPTKNRAPSRPQDRRAAKGPAPVPALAKDQNSPATPSTVPAREAPQVKSPTKEASGVPETDAERKRRIEEEMLAHLRSAPAPSKTKPTSPSDSESQPPPANPPSPPQTPKSTPGDTPSKPTVVTEASLAKIDFLVGQAFLVRGGQRGAIAAGDVIRSNDGLTVSDQDSLVKVTYPDGSWVRFHSGTEVTQFGAEKNGTHVFMRKGALEAHVQKQPKDHPVILATPHGEVTVVGTTLRVTADLDTAVGTKVDVLEGKVQVRNLAGSMIEVSAGHSTVAAVGSPLRSKKLIGRAYLVETFTDPKEFARNWNPLPGGFPFSSDRFLEIDVSHREADPYDIETWHRPGGIGSTLELRPPFRVSFDLEMTTEHSEIFAGIALAPVTKLNDDREHIRISRRGEVIRIDRQGNQPSLASVSTLGEGSWPRKDNWSVLIDGSRIVAMLNGKERLTAPYASIDQSFSIRLIANAKSGIPRGSVARFDNVLVEPVRR